MSDTWLRVLNTWLRVVLSSTTRLRVLRPVLVLALDGAVARVPAARQDPFGQTVGAPLLALHLVDAAHELLVGARQLFLVVAECGHRASGDRQLFGELSVAELQSLDFARHIFTRKHFLLKINDSIIGLNIQIIRTAIISSLPLNF